MKETSDITNMATTCCHPSQGLMLYIFVTTPTTTAVKKIGKLELIFTPIKESKKQKVPQAIMKPAPHNFSLSLGDLRTIPKNFIIDDPTKQSLPTDFRQGEYLSQQVVLSTTRAHLAFQMINSTGRAKLSD